MAQTNRVTSRRHTSQLEGVFPGQRWDNMNIKKNDSNWFKYIKSKKSMGWEWVDEMFFHLHPQKSREQFTGDHQKSLKSQFIIPTIAK